ncbi:MAG: Ig-like domain-containing protein, partial [Planctomycetes bacterium]|nr:Ig-like domain-containing protein [Planctomycetota bacterium]
MLSVRRFALALVVAGVAMEAVAADSLVLLPQRFTLSGPDAAQTLLLQRFENGTLRGPASAVKLTSSDPNIVRIEDGRAVAAGNGTATLTARADGAMAICEVTVADYDRPPARSFRNHVQSVLSKMGCNSGACHGAAAGKNGFRLSLRGYDPGFDFFSITRQSGGRRIVPDDPGRSLILTKPSGAVPHKGGVRFKTGSPEYRVLSEWIAAGNPGPAEDDPRLERLEILPAHVVLDPGATQQIVVRAHFTDGRAEDATRWVKFTSNNQSVAKIDSDGRLTVTGHGEGTVVAWYLSNNVVAQVTVPFNRDVAADFYASATRANFIDDLVLEKLRDLKLPPSPPASDAEFLRRAHLDTIGVLPTVEESRLFLADDSPGKRERLVESLLNRPEFVDYWTYEWS